MLRRTMLSRLAGGTALAASIGCSTRQEPAAGPIKVRIIGGRTLPESSLYVAHERGYFKDAGFDVEIDNTISPASALSMLATGKVEAHFTSLGVPFLAAVEKGLPVRIVAGREIASPTCGSIGVIFAMKKRFPKGLDNAAVLKGKTIGVGSQIGFPQFALDNYLSTAGLSVEDIIPRTLRSPEAVTAVISGSLDAAILNWDFDKNFERVMADTVRSPGLGHYYPNLQISHIFFGPTMLERDPAVGGRFLAAYLKGAREFVAGATPEYMKKFATQSAVDPQTVIGMCRDTFTLTGDIDMKSVKILSDWAFKRKYLSAPLEPTSLVDTRFIERAHAS